MAARFFIGGVAAEIVLWIAHTPHEWTYAIAWALALGPLAWSLLAFVLPPSGQYACHAMGARAPSEREREVIDEALSRLNARAENVPRPARVWVLDGPDDNAFAVGRSIVVSRVCWEQTLECSLAHELGHLALNDGRDLIALDRLQFRLIPERGWVTRFLSGELALVWARVGWGQHFRHREHDADSYAARLGCAEELADYFESVVSYDRPVPFRWLSDAQHPPTEYRIERLREASSFYDDEPEGDLA
jgi:Zn-dependent protease with chaperone function